MKTKHLLWALALPAVFAACQNDEFESISQENDAVLNRPMAGEVKFNFSSTDADTRLNSDFEFELGDEIGATLMDEYLAAGGGNSIYGVWNGNIYKFVDYIQTNYRYTNTENGWENSNLLCAGNYFFYYPYTPTLNTRVAFEKYLNPDQILEANTSEAARKMINDNQMYVGYSLVEGATEGSTSVLDVTMKPVFAFPFFSLECKDSEVTIQKIALQFKDKTRNWPLNAQVAPASAVASGIPTAIKTTVSGVDYIDYAKDPVTAVKYTEDPGKLDKDAVTSARQIQVTFPEGTVTKNGQKVNAYMVIPADNYVNAGGTDKTVELLIYTNKGLVTADLSAPHENAGAGTSQQYNVTNDVAMGAVYGDIDKMDGKKYRVINITFDEVAITKPADFTATSTEDLDTYLQWYASIGGNATLNVKSTGKNVELTKAACEILNNNKLIKVTINGDITIAADAPANAWDLVTFSGKNEAAAPAPGQTVYNKATLDKVGNITTSDLTIVNEGTMTLTGLTYNNIKIQNKGVMNINGQTNKTTSMTLTKNNEDFLNEATGTLNINNTFTLTSNHGIGNYGVVNISAKKTTGKIENLFQANPTPTMLYWRGAIVVAEGASWELKGKDAYNKGEIDNYGTITMGTGAVYNNGDAAALLQYYGADGKMKEFVEIIRNYGSITNITNNSEVEMMNTTASYSTVGLGADGGEGMVDNTVCNNKITANEKETIYCEVSKPMTFTEVDEFIAKSNSKLVRFVEGANTLTINAMLDAEGKVDVTMSPKIEVDEVEVLSNLTIVTANKDVKARIYGQSTTEAMGLTVKENVTLELGDFVKLAAGRNRASAEFTIEEDGALEITNSAYLTGYLNNQLTISGTVRNYGRVGGASTAYAEGTTSGWTGNNASTTAIE